MSFDSQIADELANLKAQYADPTTPRRDLLLLEIQKRQQALGSSNGGNPGGGGGTTATFYEQVMAANDLTISYTYANAGTADERVTQITYTSATVGRTVTEIINYAGSSGSFRVSSRVRGVS